MDFIGQPDAPAFLAHVKDYAGFGLGHLLHGGMQLCSAITAQRAEDIARQAFTMHAHQGGFVARRIAHHQGNVKIVIRQGLV